LSFFKGKLCVFAFLTAGEREAFLKAARAAENKGRAKMLKALLFALAGNLPTCCGVLKKDVERMEKS